MRDRASTLAATIAITLVIAIVVVSFSSGMGSWRSTDAEAADSHSQGAPAEGASSLLEVLREQGDDTRPTGTESSSDAATRVEAERTAATNPPADDSSTDATRDDSASPTLRVLGRCVDRFGQPLVGVTIEAECHAMDADVLEPRENTTAPSVERGATTGRSSALGHFELALAPPPRTTISLGLRHDDFAPVVLARPAARIAGSWNLGDVTLDAGVVLTGRVVDAAGAAVAAARVELVGDDDPESAVVAAQVRTIVTDPDGGFRWLRVPRGRFRVAVRGALEPSCHVLSPRIDATGSDVDATFEVGELVLPAATSLTGLVVDQDGLPLANVRVECASNQDFGRVLVPPMHTRSVTSGGFGFDGVPIGAGGARLTLRREGHVTTRLDVATPNADRVVVVLPLAGSVRGVVTRAEDGIALRDFAVRAVAIDRDTFDSPAAERRFVLAHAPRTSERQADDGGFVVSDLAPGRYRLVVAAARRIAVCCAPITIRATTSPQVELALELGVELRGRVLAADGAAPIAAATVTIEPMDPQVADAAITLQCDAEGRFESPVLAPMNAGMRVLADARGFVIAERQVRLRAGETADVELRLARGASVHGRVDWLPAGASGIVRAREATTGRRCAGEIDTVTSSYRIDGLAPGEYFVELDLDGGSFAQRVAALFARMADAGSPDFVIDRVGAIVRHDPRDPAAEFAVIEGGIEPRMPSGAVLRLRSAEAEGGVLAAFQPRAVIAADGRYRFESVPPGRWLLELVDARGTSRHSEELTIPRGSRTAHDVRWRRD